MLEIAIGILILIGVVVLLLRRRPKKQSPVRHKPTAYVCSHCGEQDCHCERRT